MQLMLISVVPLLFVILSLASFQFYQTQVNIENQMAERGHYITQQAQLMSEFYLYTANVEKLTEVADLMIKIDDVKYIRFSDSNGNLFVERGAHKSANPLDHFYHVVRSSGIQLSDFDEGLTSHFSSAELGTVLIGLSRNSLTKLQEEGYYLAMLFSGFSLLLGIVFIYLFGNKFHLAMDSLLTSARAVKKSRYTQYCSENGSGELLVLQKAFNEMIDSLQRNETDLQNKIKQATLSLEQTVLELEDKNKQLADTKKEALTLERSKAIEEERSRIMKDMHDGIGGQLVALLSLMELEPDTEATRHIKSILSDCLDDFRLIINSLNIQENTLSSLLANFKYRINKKLAKLNIDLKWDIIELSDDILVEPQQSLHILRIIQEAFTNILKHAEASKIRFFVSSTSEQVIIEIEDNGQNLRDFNPGTGHGIKNMEWRAKELGGKISFKHLPNTGFTMVLILPVNKENTI